MNEEERTRPAREWMRARLMTVLAIAGILVLAIWTIGDLGGFDLESTVQVDGAARTLTSTFATVDHPFHATRADMLLESLRHGELLRWVGSHQGGYPVEFYPLGIQWLDLGLWALLLGQFPIIAVHKVMVLLVFVSPVAGFWILARGDRANPFTPFLALAIHLSVPGDWMHGGRMELVYWGLISNVGGASLAFAAMAALSRWVQDRIRGYAILAIGCISAAMYTNPRSSVAIAVAAAGVLGALLIRDGVRNRDAWIQYAWRIGIVAAISACLCAPLLLSALRYNHLYYFTNFESYADLGEILWASKTAITPVFLALAIGGVVVSLWGRRDRHGVAVALTLLLYVGATAILSQVSALGDLVQQLETPRLMPFQRLLSIYLAAWFAAWLVERTLIRITATRLAAMTAGVLAVAGLLVVVTFRGAFGELPTVYQQPVPWTTGYPEFGYFTDAVDEADDLRPDGTAILIVGDRESWWHEALWAPAWSNAAFYYDDWMWYWHADHEGPYDNDVGHAYQAPAEIFTADWFGAHGVGAMMVTNMPVPTGAEDPRVAARTNPNVRYVDTIGAWDLYTVNDPVPMVTNGQSQPRDVEFDNGRISATFDDASGAIEIRHNWFPRWQAYADGQRVEVERMSNGYMRVEVPPGTRELELRYEVNAVDWVGRILAGAGMVFLGTFAVGWPRLRRRWQS